MIKPTLLTKVLFGGLWLLLFQCHLCAQKQSCNMIAGKNQIISFKDSIPQLINHDFAADHNWQLSSDSLGNPLFSIGAIGPMSFLFIEQWNSKERFYLDANYFYDYDCVEKLVKMNDFLFAGLFSYGDENKENVHLYRVYINGNRVLKLDYDSIRLPLGGQLSVPIRHADGKRWWHVVNEFQKNQVISGILSYDKFTAINRQTLPEPIEDRDYVLNLPWNPIIYPDSLQWEDVIKPALLDRDQIQTTEISPEGDQLAYLLFNGKIIVYDFDRCSGQLSNYRVIQQSKPKREYNNFILYYDTLQYFIDLKFSPDGSKLYFSTEDTLFQYDLTTNNYTKNIIFTEKHKQMGDTNNALGKMNLAHDGKIYLFHLKCISGIKVLSDTNSHFLGVISKPNLSGSNCNYIHSGFYTGANHTNPFFRGDYLPLLHLPPLLFTEVARTHRYTYTLYVCPTDTVRLGTFARPNIRYRWSPSDQLNSDTLATPTFAGEKTGTYRYILTVTGLPGSCWENETASDTLWIIVREKKDTLCKHVGIESFIPQEKPFIKVYPNPAQETVIIRYPVQDHYHMSLLDITGRELLSFRLNPSGEHTLDVSTLPEGIYLLRFDGQIQIPKLLIIR